MPRTSVEKLEELESIKLEISDLQDALIPLEQRVDAAQRQVDANQRQIDARRVAMTKIIEEK